MQPELAHEGADLGIKIFVDNLFPYLLPYLILTQWLLRLTNISSIPQGSKWRFYVQLYCLGALGGFPTGAATTGFLYQQQQLTQKEARYLLAICHAPSPLFVVGFVGMEILRNPISGWQMLGLFHFVNIIMLVIFILVFRKTVPLTNLPPKPKDAGNPLIESIKSSLPTVLLVAATVIFFTTLSYVFTQTLENFVDSLPKSVMLSLYSILEMTSGLAASENFYGHSSWLPLIVITILSMQGLSIHMQVAVLAREAKISLKPYISARVLQTLVVPLLYWIIFM